MGNGCSSVAFGLIQGDCQSTNKLLSINDTVIENVTNIMTSTTNSAVTQLNVSQVIMIEADVINCQNLNVGNRVTVDVVVNQEIDDRARADLLAAIDNVTEWDAVQDNEETTGWFSNPAAGMVNDVEVANYFRALTEQTLTVERLNSITNSMYIDQQIVINVRELSGTNCNITNDVMVRVFVTQALYGILEAFQSSTYDLDTNLQLKQSLERENRGIFESFFGSKKGKFTTIAVVLGAVLVIGGVIFAIVMSSKKKSSSSGGGSTIIAPVPQPSINSPSDQIEPQVPRQIPTQIPQQRPVNGTIEVPLAEQIPTVLNNGGGRRVTGRVYTQNSRQPT